jgi:hypothetical protein
MSSRVLATALRRAATMARPTVMAAARPAFRQSAIKAATVSLNLFSLQVVILIQFTFFNRSFLLCNLVV